MVPLTTLRGVEALKKHIEMDPPAPELEEHNKQTNGPGVAAVAPGSAATGANVMAGGARESEPCPFPRKTYTSSARYLGCEHVMGRTPIDSGLAVKLLSESAEVHAIAADKPKEVNEIAPKMKNAVNNELNYVKQVMSGSLQRAIDKYLAVAPEGTKLREAKTPFIDEALLPDGQENNSNLVAGALAKDASSVLMSLPYTARRSRYDLLRPVCAVASMVSRWNTHCDRLLYKLICYVNSTMDNVFMYAFIGDSSEDLTLRLYTDADLASCELTEKSTSGVFLVLRGPNSWFPLVGVSTKQTATSHSSTESELVGEDLGLRKEAIPMLDILNVLNGGKDSNFGFYGDNQSSLEIIRIGKNPTMRHFSRQHGIYSSVLHDHYEAGLFNLRYAVTDRQCGDIYTKRCVDAAKWSRLLCQIGHYNDMQPTAPWIPKKQPIDVEKKSDVQHAEGGPAFSATAPMTRSGGSLGTSERGIAVERINKMNLRQLREWALSLTQA